MSVSGKEKFETALSKLEKIVGRIEKGELSLDESLKLFEEGVALSRLCRSRLDEAERRVEALLKDEEGNLRERPFEEGPTGDGEGGGSAESGP